MQLQFRSFICGILRFNFLVKLIAVMALAADIFAAALCVKSGSALNI